MKERHQPTRREWTAIISRRLEHFSKQPIHRFAASRRFGARSPTKVRTQRDFSKDQLFCKLL